MHEIYNNSIEKFVEPVPGMWAKKNAPNKLSYRANYMPHMFIGNFRVWVNRKTDTKLENPEHVVPVGNRISAEYMARQLRKKYGKDYTITIQTAKKTGVSNQAVDAFQEALIYAERTGKSDVAKTIHEIQNKILGTRGFQKHTIKRKNIPGYAGSAEGFAGVRDFLNGYQLYVQGAISKAEGFKFHSKVNSLLDRAEIKANYPITRNLAILYKENALGNLKNPITEKVQKMTRKWAGDTGVEKALGFGNKVTLGLKLLFLQPRFILATGIQPYQMIPAKLANLQSKGYKGDIWEAIIKTQKDMIVPDKYIRELHDYAGSQRVAEQKFLQEFAEGMSMYEYQVGKTKKVIDIAAVTNLATMKNVTGRFESYSRLNATTMFYNFLRKAGLSHKKSMVESASLGDKYMVEYNSMERPAIYGERGLGVLGKPFGLFKTFQHNYFAQLTEHIQQMSNINLLKDPKSIHHAKGAVAFASTMVLSAGLYSVIGIEMADMLLKKLSPVWQRLTGNKLRTVTQTLLESDLPDWMKWGVPSAAVQADLTSTLAAPGLGFGDLVSTPTLEVLGLHPSQLGFPGFRNRREGIMQTSFGFAYKGVMGTATMDDAQKFYSSIFPVSLQGVLEKYYSGNDTFVLDHTPGIKYLLGEKPSKTNLIRDPWKKGRGEVRRNAKDWYARYMSSYSLEEATTLKTIYQLSVIERGAQNNQETLVKSAAHLVVKGHAIPGIIFDLSLQNNVPPDKLFLQIKNRIKLMTTTLLEREIKTTNIHKKASTHDLIQPVYSAELKKNKPIIITGLKEETVTPKDGEKKLRKLTLANTGGGGGFSKKSFMDKLAIAESGGDEFAVSSKGAQGLYQIMPATAKNPGFGVTPLNNPFDAKESRRFATEYMNALLKEYGGNQLLALVAWNWGITNANKWIEQGSNFSKLPIETQQLIKKVLDTAEA